MSRLLFPFALAFAALCSLPHASAGIIVSTSGVPTSFSPGDSFLVDLLIADNAGATIDLSAYSFDLTLESQQGTAGIDFLFGPLTEPTDTADFVFRHLPAGASLYSLSNTFPIDDSAQLTLANFLLDDLTFAPVQVTLAPGERHVLAQVQIITTAAAGDLTLTIGPTVTLQDAVQAADFSFPSPTLPYTTSAPDVVLSTDSGGAIVPEPGSLAIWSLLGAGGLFVQRNKERRRAASQP